MQLKYSMEIMGNEVNLEYLEKPSVYNNNYFKIIPLSYGDAYGINTYGNDILFTHCDEDWDYYEYQVGHFEGNKFVPVFGWDSEYEDQIKTEEIK